MTHKTKQLDCLKLSLKKEWFDQVASGKKKTEYREKSGWIMSRLRNKEYKKILFVNGYGDHRPHIWTEYNGHKVFTDRVEIYIGEILDTKNF